MEEHIWMNSASVDEIPSEPSYQKNWDISLATNDFNLLDRSDVMEMERHA